MILRRVKKTILRRDSIRDASEGKEIPAVLQTVFMIL